MCELLAEQCAVKPAMMTGKVMQTEVHKVFDYRTGTVETETVKTVTLRIPEVQCTNRNKVACRSAKPVSEELHNKGMKEH